MHITKSFKSHTQPQQIGNGGEGKGMTEDELQRKAMEEEEKRMAELRRLGTPVTPEHFEAWRVKFVAEMALQQTRCVHA